MSKYSSTLAVHDELCWHACVRTCGPCRELPVALCHRGWHGGLPKQRRFLLEFLWSVAPTGGHTIGELGSSPWCEVKQCVRLCLFGGVGSVSWRSDMGGDNCLGLRQLYLVGFTPHRPSTRQT